MSKISDEGREILKKWQDMGVKFLHQGVGCGNFYRYGPIFCGDAEDYSIPEQPMPKSWTSANFNGANYYGLKFNTGGDWSREARISAQPIPKELLETEDPKKEILIHHIPERKLWLEQREAGTNEQWQRKLKAWGDWSDLPNDREPEWLQDCEYRVKPKTVKYYFCVVRHKNGSIGLFGQYGPKEAFESSATFEAITIIGADLTECLKRTVVVVEAFEKENKK